MEDEAIVALYWARDEGAIPATAEKYGAYCASIAGNILESPQDAEECVNDTYLSAWNAMPPSRPRLLKAFLGKITRNLSLNRVRHHHAWKRGGGAVMEELGEISTGADPVGEAIQRRELLRAIDTFLEGLPKRQRQLFVCRYWYFDSVTDLAARFQMTENHVSVTLRRIREKLRRNLLERGFEL